MSRGRCATLMLILSRPSTSCLLVSVPFFRIGKPWETSLNGFVPSLLWRFPLLITHSVTTTELTHHLPESSHRGPIDRVLSRFIGDRLPCTNPARTARVRWMPAGRARGGRVHLRGRLSRRREVHLRGRQSPRREGSSPRQAEQEEGGSSPRQAEQAAGGFISEAG